MFTQRTTVIIIIVLLLLSYPAQQGVGEKAQKFSPTESKEILNRIYARYAKFYNRYAGFSSMRTNYTREYDADNGKLLATIVEIIKRRDYFFREPSIKPIRLIKNGQNRPLSEYRKGLTDPIYPVFSREGRKRYKVQVLGSLKFKGRRAYKLRISPKYRTTKHYRGIAYVDTETLDWLYLRGSLADYPTGVKDLRFNFYFSKHSSGWPVLTHGSTYARIYFPLIQPHRKLKNNFKSENIKLISR